MKRIILCVVIIAFISFYVSEHNPTSNFEIITNISKADVNLSNELDILNLKTECRNRCWGNEDNSEFRWKEYRFNEYNYLVCVCGK